MSGIQDKQKLESVQNVKAHIGTRKKSTKTRNCAVCGKKFLLKQKRVMCCSCKCGGIFGKTNSKQRNFKIIRRTKGNVITIKRNILYIHLVNHLPTIIDSADYNKVKNYTWHYNKKGPQTNINGSTLKLSRFILFGYNCFKEKKMVDHINHNVFDNRKCNLRSATNQENMFNRLPTNGTSEFKGVTLNNSRWVSRIVKNKIINLGSFDTEIEAAKAYDNAAKKLYGNFACLNFR